MTIPKLRLSSAVALLATIGLSLTPTIARAKEVTSARSNKTLDVDTLLKIATIGDSPVLGWRGYEKELYHVSPDGTRIAFVVLAGDPENDARKGQIFLVNASDLLDQTRTTQPEKIAEFASRTNDQPIANLSWENDRSLIFAASQGDTLPQVFRLDVGSKRITQLTNETLPISAFAASDGSKGLLLITGAASHIRMEEDPICRKQGCQITADRFYDATSGVGDRAAYPGNLIFYDPAGVRRELPSLYDQKEIRDCAPNDFVPGGMSPDGRYVLFFCTRSSWPNWWREYNVNERFSKMMAQGNGNYAKQYFLLDLKLDQIRPINSAPFMIVAPANDPIWIDGGSRLLLVGAVEPLAGFTGAERQKRATSLGVVSVDPATGSTNFEFALDPTKFRYIAKARWNQKDRTLAIETILPGGKSGQPLAWKQVGKDWAAIADPTSVSSLGPVKLELQQSPNSRPVLYASNGGRAGRELFDPNPWLDDYKLGQVEEIQWKSIGGHDWDGAIYYPPNYMPGRKYPLVILTHGVNLGTFSPQGYARNFAAQPLASRGMIVLQMNERGLSDVGTSPKEMPRSREGVESAIDEMDRRGLIDRSRVGLVGWSRTSWYLTYMATHSNYPLKATMITDGGDIGWWAYLASGVMDEVDIDLGAPPFGKGLVPMLETAATFNLNRWRAPFLMWSAGDGLDMWDLYAGLRRLGSPVEYWYFPDGTHDLYKMSQLRAGNALMVDWFDFWLNGREVPDPSKSAQFQRWRKLREQEERKSVEPRPPLLNWTATEAMPAR